MTHSQHLIHTGKECLCLKPERRAASLLPLPPLERKDVMQICIKGASLPHMARAAIYQGNTQGLQLSFSFKRKPVSCCFWIQCLLTAVWRHIPPHGQLLHSFTVFTKLACLTEHIHCSIPCTKPSDSFLKCLCASVCT